MNMRRIAAILSCSLVLAVPAEASFALEQGSEPASVGQTQGRTIALSVDASALGDQGTGIDKIIIDKLRPHFEAAGIELVDADAAISLQVRFELLRKNKFDYGVRFEFVSDTGTESAAEWVACMTCIDTTLLELLDAKAPELVTAVNEKLAAAEAPTTSESGDEGNEQGDEQGSTQGSNDTEEPDASAAPPPIGPMGIVGVVGLVAGVGLSIGGGVELGRGEVGASTPSSLTSLRTDHRPAGRALLGAGVGAAVVGVALLATDLALRAKKRKHAAARSVIVDPTLGPEFTGLSIHGRF